MQRSNRSVSVLFKIVIALCWSTGVPPLRSCAQVTATGGTNRALSQPASIGSEGSPARTRPVISAGRRTVGLALEGGGALGLAHVGVLAWMSQHHVPVDRIAGTSMGPGRLSVRIGRHAGTGATDCPERRIQHHVRGEAVVATPQLSPSPGSHGPSASAHLRPAAGQLHLRHRSHH